MSNNLRGIILRDEGAELIIQASASEVAQFARGGSRDVFVGRGRMTQTLAHAEAAIGGHLPMEEYVATPGTRLFDAQGRQVGMVVDVRMDADRLDTTVFGAATRTSVVHQRTITLRVEAVYQG